MARPGWPENDVNTLRRMLRQNKTSTEIGIAIGRSAATVRQYISNHKTSMEEVLLDRERNGGRMYTNFEKEWKGSVPFMHWAMVKPWRLEQ